MNIRIDHSLRFYVRDLYIKRAANRGGEVYNAPYKKYIKPFQIRVKFAVDRSLLVLDRISERYPIELN